MTMIIKLFVDGRYGTIFFLLLCLLACEPFISSSCRVQTERPNIILILSDDQTPSDLSYMPKTLEHIISPGTQFGNAFVVQAACCPSRASILTGQYSHNHKVLSNKPPRGGFPVFYQSGKETSTLATWLQNAGYYTALVGKYLNSYPGVDQQSLSVNESYIPPGWDEWYALQYKQPYYKYQLNINGQVKRFKDEPEDYSTDVFSNFAEQFIDKTSCKNKPFFLFLSPTAPHTPETPAVRHQNLFNNIKVPRPPSFNEADVSDKPTFIQAFPLLNDNQITLLDNLYRSRLQMLQALDELVEKVVLTLEGKNLLTNTYLIYMSDNGFRFGNHRIASGIVETDEGEERKAYGKGLPYEEDIRIPLAIRGPGVPEGVLLDSMVLNIDIAPTIAEFANISIPDDVDGMSFVPLLQDQGSPWRNSFLVQGGWNQDISGPSFASVRTQDYKYTEWYAWSGEMLPETEHELYHLKDDPFELDNLYEQTDDELLQGFILELERLRTCSGQTCF
jgi:arylsulfatase A-like enzyme